MIGWVHCLDRLTTGAMCFAIVFFFMSDIRIGLQQGCAVLLNAPARHHEAIILVDLSNVNALMKINSISGRKKQNRPKSKIDRGETAKLRMKIRKSPDSNGNHVEGRPRRESVGKQSTTTVSRKRKKTGFFETHVRCNKVDLWAVGSWLWALRFMLLLLLLVLLSVFGSKWEKYAHSIEQNST